jgi:hypothetical protein
MPEDNAIAIVSPGAVERRAAVALLAGLVLAGCAARPLVWFGMSADRRHRVEVVARGDQQFVRFDRLASPDYLAVGVSGLVIGGDGAHLAYPAQLADGWAVVVDGKRGQAWDGIASVVLDRSGQHHAYAAQRGPAWQVVRDGEVGPAFDGLLAGSLVFGADGRLAYAGERAGQSHVVVGSEIGPAFSAVGKLAFSADGESFGYQGRRGDAAFAVVNGVEFGPFEAIEEVSLSPARGRSALVVRRDGGWHAVVDGAEGPAFDRISAVVWSPDGKRWAYAAKRGKDELVVLDGVELGPYQAVAPESLRFDESGLRFAFVASRAGKPRMVLDGDEGPAFDEVGAPVFAPGVLGYVGRLEGTSRVVLDGTPGPAYPAISDLVFSRDGKRSAYVVREAGRQAVVHPDGKSPFDVFVEGTLAFGPDGRHWGCVAGNATTRKLFFAVDGLFLQLVDGEELAATAAALSPAQRLARPPDAVILRRWVEAELAKYNPPVSRPKKRRDKHDEDVQW